MADAALARDGVNIVPPHVPNDLIIDCDFHSDPGFKTDPFGTVAWQTTGPRIFYTPTHYLLPGAWVVTRAEDIRYIYQTPDLFSSKGQVSFAALIDETWDLIPVELDPPLHTSFRTLLNPLFSPKEVGKLDGNVRAASSRLIDNFVNDGEVDFFKEFAQPFPVSVFLELMGLPVEEMPTFLKWENGLLKSFRLQDRKDAARSIIGYLRDKIRESLRNPGEDVISWATHSKVDGRNLTEDEVTGICFTLFVAGLDTVASSLGFHYHHLATHPKTQAMLRADRSLIPAAIEEFLRLYSIAQSHRRVMRDTELGGVTLKQGDWVHLAAYNGSRDHREFDRPFEFVIDRPVNRHVAFAYGPHRCIGSHLARREFVVAMNEMFDRLPPFTLADGDAFRGVGGAVFGVEKLVLKFDRG